MRFLAFIRFHDQRFARYCDIASIIFQSTDQNRDFVEKQNCEIQIIAKE